MCGQRAEQLFLSSVAGTIACIRRKGKLPAHLIKAVHQFLGGGGQKLVPVPDNIVFPLKGLVTQLLGCHQAGLDSTAYQTLRQKGDTQPQVYCLDDGLVLTLSMVGTKGSSCMAKTRSTKARPTLPLSRSSKESWARSLSSRRS